MKRNMRSVLGFLVAAAVMCSLNGCAQSDGTEGQNREPDTIGTEAQNREPDAQGTEEPGGELDALGTEEQRQERDTSGTEEPGTLGETGEDTLSTAASGEELDVIEPNPKDDDWYKRPCIYIDEEGNRLEVFFDDGGMLEFAVNGLSLYDTRAEDYQLENNWRVYTCEDGTVIVYYPGEPAHIEIYDGDSVKLYEAASGD